MAGERGFEPRIWASALWHREWKAERSVVTYLLYVSGDVDGRGFSHEAWLTEGQLLCDAGRLAGIPGVLIHGRQDMGSPVGTAWELARAWPDACLTIVTDSGHTGSDTMRDELLQAVDRFASR
jgi:pimeloyl-ACP methyl ester carboxylesterase